MEEKKEIKVEDKESKTPERETIKLPEQEEKKDLMFDKPIEEMTKEEIIKTAEKWGHHSKESHKGDPDKWQDPETFLKKAREQVPAHINQIKKLTQVVETQNRIIDNQKKQLEIQRADLEPKMKDAFESGDFTTYKKLERQDAEITRQVNEYNRQIVKPEEGYQDIDYTEEASRWLEAHPEYFTDKRVQYETDKLFNKYKAEHPYATPTQIIQAVDIGIRNLKSSISMQSTQSKPSTMGKVTKTKSFDNLTEGSKKAYTAFIRNGGDKQVYIDNCSDENFIWHK
jgi:hypothetical protein